MQDRLESLKSEALAAVAHADSESTLDQVRVLYLGKSGSISTIGAQMKSVPPAERPIIGKLLHEVRTRVTDAIQAKHDEIQAAHDAEAAAALDPSLPGIGPNAGTLHPFTQVLERVTAIFRRMGFALAEGPDVESEFRNFDALNTPPEHPARNESDTFYFDDGQLLRTHTSTVQILTMENEAPPVRIIAPGTVYRRDEVDATHQAQFNQVEGLFVAPGVHLGDLKGTIEFFFRELFGPETTVRFRPHFFPFTEPSFEIDVRAEALKGGADWMEIAGCGMVDPAVFEAVCESRGDRVYDPEIVSGFAFGFGLDRLAMTGFRVPDIRYFSENDLRFLTQFKD